MSFVSYTVCAQELILKLRDTTKKYKSSWSPGGGGGDVAGGRRQRRNNKIQLGRLGSDSQPPFYYPQL